MRISNLRIAVAFDANFKHATEIYGGVSRFVKENGLPWQLMPLNYGFESQLVTLAENRKISGAIGTFVSDAWIDRLRDHGVSAVNLFNLSEMVTTPTVSPDDEAIGFEAARHLKSQNARSFVFYGSDNAFYAKLRRRAFSQDVGNKNSFWLRPSDDILRFVEDLETELYPLGVFCSTDSSARDFINRLQTSELKVGRDVLVVGVGDDARDSIFAGREITSFALPVEKMGHAAAKLLVEQLEGVINHSDKQTHLKLPGTLIPRDSSLPSDKARLAQRAIQICDRAISEIGFDVGQFAQRCGVSRRTLEKVTQDHLQTSPYRMIATRRTELAKQLLQTTRLPIQTISHRCGYPEAHHFSAWFKTQVGISPKNYRLETTLQSDKMRSSSGSRI